MTRIINVVKNAKLENLTGRHAQVTAKITATNMNVSDLRKSCRSLKPKRFRQIVRELVSARIVSVRRVKAA